MARKAARKVSAKKKKKKSPTKKKATKKKATRKKAGKKRAVKKQPSTGRGLARSGAGAVAATTAAPLPNPIVNIPLPRVGQVVQDLLSLDGVLDVDVREQVGEGLFAVIPRR